MKTDLFQSCGHCWGFEICWYTECSTFTASSFRSWNKSIGIPSPPLALFIVRVPKAHLSSHSRMFDSRWVITPSWLSESWKSILYSSSGYCCHLFLISSASVRSIPFPSFIVPMFAWNVPLVSLIFLKRSLVFPILLFSSISLRKAFLSLLAIFWNSAFKWVYLSFCPLPLTSLLSSAICKASSTMSQTSVPSCSGALSIRSNPWIYLSLPLYNPKGYDWGHTWMVCVFPYFFQFKSEFCNKEFIIWATVSSQSCFCWLYRASPFLAAKNIINLISVLTIWWCPCVESSLVLLEEGVCYSLGKSLLAFALLHSVLQGQICLLLQVFLDFLLLHSSPL